MLDNYTQIAYNKDVDKTCTKGVKMDIKSVRDYMNMSQKEFSEFWGININTLQNWEQGRAKAPDYLQNIFYKYFDLETRFNAQVKAFDNFVGLCSKE